MLDRVAVAGAWIVIYALINLPIVMMILFNYFREIHKETLEASRMDGTSTYNEITQIVMPLAWGASPRPRCCRLCFAGMRRFGR